MGPPGQVLEKASTFRKTIWTNLARFGSKSHFLMKFLDDSASFFGQETHEHVKTIKKGCLEAKNGIFVKMHLKKMFS